MQLWIHQWVSPIFMRCNVSMSGQTKGLLLGTIAVLLFSFTLPLSAYVTQQLDPWFVGLGRTAFAGIFAAGILWGKGVSRPTRYQFKWLALSALGITFGFPVSISIAMSLTESSRGIIVVGILPLVTAVMGAVLAKEQMPKKFWFFAVLAAVLVFAFTATQQTSGPQWADLLLLVAVFTAGFGYATGGRLSKEMPGWQVISWTLVIAMPFFWLPAFLLFPAQPFQIDLGIWGGFVYLTVVSQLFGFFIWNAAMAIGGIAVVSQTQLLQVFFSLLISSWMFAEALDNEIWLFAILIIFIVALGNQNKRSSDRHNTNAKSNCE
ncbi:DMT family transporter [Paraglaciecola aquimarina]|uniref:DMT family transporter n=1 Tax=Paraglaciecola aquimarina TaxID=1235557 RepID=A0ABU3SW12_9ALTE|nr:DMT family transporter [Paraglaciecola aquimarina]MDU0354185.1 DMT family transporter [Paraglaciecola aquimarina]